MLEARDYSISELGKVLNTTGKQNIDRKLQRQCITFTSRGRGNRRVYTITEIPDSFKIYAITKLGIPAQSKFTNIRNLYFYLFCAEGFAEMPLVEMERILGNEGILMSRQTISKWINYLQHIDYITFSASEFKYYVIRRKPSGQKECVEIDKETYTNGWKLYFQCKEAKGSKAAYALMYNTIGGHPYKKAQIMENAFYQEEIEELIEVLNESFLENPM